LSNLDAILAAAKNQAANLPAVPAAAAAGVPAIGPNGAVPSTGYNMSMDAFLNPGGMECESYVQVKEGGIKLSKDWVGFIDEFDAILNLSEVQFFIGIRKEVGSQVTYAKSYDGQTTSRGENFAAVVEEFKRTSQKPADTYRGADIPLTLLAGIADPKGKGPALEADAIVGLTTSITGFKPFAAFAKKLQQAGLGNTPVKVRVKHAARKNAQNQAYGVCEFDVLEVIGADAAAA
jgi:hypothetical protein